MRHREGQIRSRRKRHCLEVSDLLLQGAIESVAVLSELKTPCLRIPRLQGGAECTLTAMGDLTATTNRVPWARPPIDVDFQVLMFTASGLLVRFLKVFEKSNYNSVKWVRYLTKAAGSYQIRVSKAHAMTFCMLIIPHWFIVLSKRSPLLRRCYYNPPRLVDTTTCRNQSISLLQVLIYHDSQFECWKRLHCSLRMPAATSVG